MYYNDNARIDAQSSQWGADEGYRDNIEMDESTGYTKEEKFPLKDDHEKRPLWITSDGDFYEYNMKKSKMEKQTRGVICKIFLENFSPLAK